LDHAGACQIDPADAPVFKLNVAGGWESIRLPTVALSFALVINAAILILTRISHSE
jgi:hypothetical protein